MKSRSRGDLSGVGVQEPVCPRFVANLRRLDVTEECVEQVVIDVHDQCEGCQLMEVFVVLDIIF